MNEEKDQLLKQFLERLHRDPAVRRRQRIKHIWLVMWIVFCLWLIFLWSFAPSPWTRLTALQIILLCVLLIGLIYFKLRPRLLSHEIVVSDWLGGDDIAEQKRYTDLTIYEGFLYHDDPLAKETRLSDEMPLVEGKPYTLEVAVRRKRTGISAQLEAPAVRNPREDKEDLTLFILAEPQWTGIEIKESFARVNWPYDADSESALFRLNLSPVDQASKGEIQVRLYDRALDLLDIVDLTVWVVPEGSGSFFPPVQPRSLSWPDEKHGSPKFDPHSPPRSLAIDVSFDAAAQEYRLLFNVSST